MTVHFDHAAHVATMWLPQLSPTHVTVVSTLAALAFCAVLIGAIAWMFASMCLEQAHPWRFGVIAALAVVALVAAVPSMRHRVAGSAPIASATATIERADALSAARAAAAPEKDWRPEAKAVAAPASSDVTWSPDDLHALSVAAQKKNGLTETYARSRIEVDSTGQDTATIAAHGTTYLTKDDKRVRCVARVKHVVKNNVGQPLSAELDQVVCAPAA